MSNTEHSGPRMKPGYESAIDEIAERGAAAVRKERLGAGAAVTDARGAHTTSNGAREVQDKLADMIRHSVRTRPYMTMAIAGLAGFVFGATRRH